MSNPNQKQQELDRLRLVLLTFTEFSRSIGLAFVDDRIWGIEEAYRVGTVRGMREALADNLEDLQDYSGEQLRVLDALLQERAGVRLDGLQQRRLARLAAIRERGRISTEGQFRLVLARVDEVYADPERSGEVAELNGLLAEYETRPRRAG